MLDQIREYLNRDIAAHGEVQGLASNYLVAELAREGVPLAYSDERGFFAANTAYYRIALEQGLDAAHAADARWRLLRGEFYDSFDADLLRTRQSQAQVLQQLALAERVVEEVTGEPDREEARFIAAVVCARAAKAATDGKERIMLKSKAGRYMDSFQNDYPDSLRSAAMPVLRQALETTR